MTFFTIAQVLTNILQAEKQLVICYGKTNYLSDQ